MTMTDVLPASVLEGMEMFLDLVRGGTGHKNAAIAAGWTLRQLADLERMPQFQEAVAAANEQMLESVEEKAVHMALAGNVPMIQMILYCKAPDRGWRPPAQRVNVNHGGTVAVERVSAVREAARAIIGEHGGTALAIGALGEGDDDGIIDAEVVDGD